MSVLVVERLDLRFAPRPWTYAEERRSEIDAYFAAVQRSNPRLWNGRVLLLHEHRVAGNALHGTFLETDYASFHMWIKLGRPDVGVSDCFGAAVVMGSDGVFLLGVMAGHTANAGRIYFPCGTPDKDDIAGDRVDFDHSVARELTEETGLDADDFAPEPGWTVVLHQNQVVACKVLRAREPGEALKARALAHLAQGRDDELVDVRLVRRPADLDPAMPDYVIDFLRHRWR